MKVQALWAGFIATVLMAPVAALEISSVAVDQSVVSLSSPKGFGLRFKIDTAADVSLNLYDVRELLVKQVRLGQLKKGEHVASWDMKDAAGIQVPPGVYHYTLSARSGDETVQYDLTEITGHDAIGGLEVKWLPESKRIRYSLSAPALVGIRAGIADRGPLLKTLVNWEPRPSGVHEEPWDGMDASAVLDLSSHPNLVLAGLGIRLPDNCLFIEAASATATARTGAVTYERDAGGQPLKREPTAALKKRIAAHDQQPADQRGDYPISLTVVDGKKQKDGSIRVSGMVSVIVDVDPSMIPRLVNQRFEQSFYIDGRYLFENEIGFFPATLQWDSSAYSEGIHYITANVRGYEGNFGMATVRVLVEH